jgi:hypothetical protein
MFIQHKELVQTPCGDVFVYFLYEEDKGSKHWYTNYPHFVFPVRTVWKECFGVIKLMCLASDVIMVTLVSEFDLQTQSVLY